MDVILGDQQKDTKLINWKWQQNKSISFNMNQVVFDLPAGSTDSAVVVLVPPARAPQNNFIPLSHFCIFELFRESA